MVLYPFPQNLCHGCVGPPCSILVNVTQQIFKRFIIGHMSLVTTESVRNSCYNFKEILFHSNNHPICDLRLYLKQLGIFCDNHPTIVDINIPISKSPAHE
uniref:Uncharacterized protein n=1 Tax=Setaria viridis TaxID=4556 RepID=A0A4U6VW68_SETVI|nr:hypothetical protein SEVIR_2G290400v2 [Setaria viridis]